jgi:hypothetical protein
MRLWDFAKEYAPHLLALVFWFTGLTLFDRLRRDHPGVFATFFGLGLVVWFVLVIVTGHGLWERNMFETRRREVASSISREIKNGRELLDKIANDQKYMHRKTCNDAALVNAYAPKVEDWKTRVQKLLDEMMPESGATERFMTVAASFPKSDCPEMDFNYWRLLAFAQNLNAIWESSAQYCLRVGPTCRK